MAFEFRDVGNDLESAVFQALGAAEVSTPEQLIEIGEALMKFIRSTHQDQGTLQYKIHRQKKMLTALEIARGVEVLDVGWITHEGDNGYFPTRIRWANEVWIREETHNAWMARREDQAKKLADAYNTNRVQSNSIRTLQDENKKLRLLLKGRPNEERA